MLHTRHGGATRSRATAPAFEALEGRTLMSVTYTVHHSALVNEFAAITAPEPANTSDFTGDGDNDLVLHDPATGRIRVLALNDEGTLVASVGGLPRLNDPTWDLAGIADFDADGDPDLFFRNLGNGRNAIWIMDGAARESVIRQPRLGTTWAVGGVGDFDGDGAADIVWENTATQHVAMWTIDDGFIDNTVTFGGLYAPGWSFAGAGDFDADGDSDILLRKDTGAHAIWYFDNGIFFGDTSEPFERLRDPNWQVGDVKDFDGDGDADIAWRNTFNHRTAIWFMADDGTRLDSTATLLTLTQSGWRLPGQSNYPADAEHASAFGPRTADRDAGDDPETNLLVDAEPLVAFVAL